MRKILLTSAGFENKRLLETFKGFFQKESSKIKALFIPTAAINVGAIAVLPKCMTDLLSAGIEEKNITVFDLHRSMSNEELNEYDVVYFTGGSPEYLLDRINATGFDAPLRQFVENGGIYVGVSAGSWIATNNLPNNLGYANCTLGVHQETGTKSGAIDLSNNPKIDLTDSSMILITGDEYCIYE